MQDKKKEENSILENWKLIQDFFDSLVYNDLIKAQINI